MLARVQSDVPLGMVRVMAGQTTRLENGCDVTLEVGRGLKTGRNKESEGGIAEAHDIKYAAFRRVSRTAFLHETPRRLRRTLRSHSKMNGLCSFSTSCSARR
jgi:hypothetical protein